MPRMRCRVRRAVSGVEEGFTLIEIILAMFLTVVVMTALLGVLVSSLKTVTQARQRQTATALATQSLERLRALPYDSVTGPGGAAYPKTSGLQYVTTSGATDTFVPTAVLPGVSETLVVNQYSGKLASTTVDGVVYTVQTYVTKPVPTTGQQAYNLTALVSWTSSVYPTTRTTAQRSTEYSPAGCLSTAQSPFAAPCQAYFTAQAGLSAAGFSVTNKDNPKSAIPGINGTLLELNLPVLSANLQIEQTASGSAVGSTSAAKGVPGAAAGVGGVSASVAVDSDPSSTPSQQQVASANQASLTPVSITGPSGTLSATPTSTDTASSAAAIQADSNTCKDADAAGTGLMTGQATQLRPCASAAAKQTAGTGTISYLTLSGTSVSVLSLQQAPQAARAVAANLATTNTGVACTTGAGAAPPGCAHSKAYRTLGDLVVGSPGLGTGPAGFDVNKGLFRVTGLVESATSERGTGAAATPVYGRAGTLTVWNGTGYTDVPLSNYQQAPTALQMPSDSWTFLPVTTTYPGGMTVTVEGTLMVQRPKFTVSGPADCSTACVAQVNGAGGITARTLFTVTNGAASTQFVLVSDIGGLVAQSTYKAAPLG